MIRLLYPLIPPPSHVNIQGSHASRIPRAQTLPAFSESRLSSLLGTLAARDDTLVGDSSGAESDALLASMSGADPRSAHGLNEIASTLSPPLRARCYTSWGPQFYTVCLRLLLVPWSIEASWRDVYPIRGCHFQWYLVTRLFCLAPPLSMRCLEVECLGVPRDQVVCRKAYWLGKWAGGATASYIK